MTEEEQRYQEGLRSPKNRFLGLFCHANDVDQSWGWNWPFSCGVIIFSIVVGLSSIYDLISLMRGKYFSSNTGLFPLFFGIRLLSDFAALVAIVFAIKSIHAIDSRSSIIGYYLLVLSLVLNTAFLIYCIIKIFNKSFWNLVSFNIIPWSAGEFILFLFTWILFCNMVDIGRKIKNGQDRFV